jgi:fructokinase
MRLGIDLGGTKIATIVLAGDDTIAWEQRIATPRGDYAATLGAIAACIGTAERHVGGTCSVGIGIPGIVSATTGLVKNANSTWLNGRPFHADLERHLQRPVRLANDANCFAMSEAADGSGAGASAVFGVILGTGTGGGVIVRGQIVNGVNGIAGEWGHNPLPWPDDDERPGPACYCGRHGCIETFLSGPGLSADYARRTGAGVASQDVFARARAGDAAARAVVTAWERRLAKSLASVINVLDPDVVVVGGGLSQVAGLYETVPELWKDWIFSDDVVTRLAPARHGDASGVRGAARLWSREDGHM